MHGALPPFFGVVGVVGGVVVSVCYQYFPLELRGRPDSAAAQEKRGTEYVSKLNIAHDG